MNRYHGPSVVFSSWLAVFCLFGYRATFAILKGPMGISLGWSSASVTLGYSVMMLVYALTAYLSGLILDRFGTRPVYGIAAILGGLGLRSDFEGGYPSGLSCQLRVARRCGHGHALGKLYSFGAKMVCRQNLCGQVGACLFRRTHGAVPACPAAQASSGFGPEPAGHRSGCGAACCR
jgi:MFS family permease